MFYVPQSPANTLYQTCLPSRRDHKSFKSAPLFHLKIPLYFAFLQQFVACLCFCKGERDFGMWFLQHLRQKIVKDVVFRLDLRKIMMRRVDIVIEKGISLLFAVPFHRNP